MVKGIDYALVVPIEIHITPFARPENSFEQYLSIIKKNIYSRTARKVNSSSSSSIY